MFKKIVKIDTVKKIPYSDSFGTIELYPDGTKRTIKNFIYGEWKYLSQVSSIKTTFGDDGCLYYNDWETIGVDQVECIREQRKKKLIKIETNENKKWFRK